MVEKFSWHSSGIGTALIAAVWEVEVPLLKTLWRWASSPNILYVCSEVNTLPLGPCVSHQVYCSLLPILNLHLPHLCIKHLYVSNVCTAFMRNI